MENKAVCLEEEVEMKSVSRRKDRSGLQLLRKKREACDQEMEMSGQATQMST